MSFGLGFWANTAGGGGGAAGAYEQIATAFGDGSSTSIIFSSIPQTYKHLQIRMTLRSSSGGKDIAPLLRYNGLSTSYRAHNLDADWDTGLWSYDAGTGSGIFMQYFPASGNTANVFGAAIIDILDYTNTTNAKTSRIFKGYTDNSTGYKVGLTSGFRPSDLSAITSLTIDGNGGAFVSASRFSLFGIKG